jgi:hypothetical protein
LDGLSNWIQHIVPDTDRVWFRLADGHWFHYEYLDGQSDSNGLHDYFFKSLWNDNGHSHQHGLRIPNGLGVPIYNSRSHSESRESHGDRVRIRVGVFKSPGDFDGHRHNDADPDSEPDDHADRHGFWIWDRHGGPDGLSDRHGHYDSLQHL